MQTRLHVTVELVALHILARAHHTRVPVHRPNMILIRAPIPRLPRKIFVALDADARLGMVQLRVPFQAHQVGKGERAGRAAVPMRQLRVVQEGGNVRQLQVAARAAPAGGQRLADAVHDGGVVAQAFSAGKVKLALATVVGMGEVRVNSELLSTLNLEQKVR